MKRSRSGRWEVRRPDNSACIKLWHVPSGLPCGSFSHLSVRTFKAAVDGVEEAEARLNPMQLQLIDVIEPGAGHDFATGQALGAWQVELRRAFPNGGWAR